MKSKIVTGITGALILLSGNTYSAQNDSVSLSQFIKMSIEQKLSICSTLVDSASLGACINFGKKEL